MVNSIQSFNNLVFISQQIGLYLDKYIMSSHVCLQLDTSIYLVNYIIGQLLLPVMHELVIVYCCIVKYI